MPLIVSQDSQIFFAAAVILFAVFAFVFWLAMLIDAIKYKDSKNPVWIIILALFGFAGSVIYYFAVKRPQQKRLRPAEPVNPESDAYDLGGVKREDIIQE